MAAQSRVKGHTLLNEGAAFQPNGSRITYHTGGGGHAQCSCGQQSEWLSSGTQRKKWHKEHKEQVIEKGGE